MRLYRALIVDDEPHVVDALWDILDSQIHLPIDIYAAYNGKLAIEMIKKGRFDLIITDIKMPEKSGIDLLEYAHRLWPMCKIILLTAHAQFSYAYEAIKNSAFSYILKTESDERIISEVKRAISSINLEQNKSAKDLSIVSQIDEMNNRLIDKLLHDLYMSQKDVKWTLSMLGFEGIDNDLYLIAGKIHQTENKMEENRIKGQDAAKEFFDTKKVINHYFNQWFNHSVLLLNRGNKLLWFVQPKTEPEHKGKQVELLHTSQWLNGLLETIQESCQISTKLDVSFVARPVKQTSMNVALTYKQIDSTFLQINNTTPYVYTFRQLSGFSPYDVNQLPLLSEFSNPVDHTLVEALVNRDKNTFWHRYNEITHMNQVNFENTHQYKLCLDKILHSVLTVIQQEKLYQNKRVADCYESIFHFWEYATLSDYEVKMKDLIDTLFDAINIDDNELTCQTINFLKKYVDDHITEDVSLMQLSSVTGYNANYLSRLFHEQTGQLLNRYIALKKIELIKTFMSDANRTIEQVIRDSGFNSRSYFNRFVKKETNMTPKEFRMFLINKHFNI